MLTSVVTEIINKEVVPKLRKLIEARETEINHAIKAAEELLKAKSMTPNEVIILFQTWLRYYYTGVITAAEDEKTKDLKIKMNQMYDKAMPALFEDLYYRLVKLGCEESDDGEDGMSLVETQARYFEAGTIAPTGDIKVWIQKSF